MNSSIKALGCIFLSVWVLTGAIVHAASVPHSDEETSIRSKASYKVALWVEMNQLNANQKAALEQYIKEKKLQGKYQTSEVTKTPIWITIGENKAMRTLESNMKKESFGNAVFVGY